jgi:hypothetical protein
MVKSREANFRHNQRRDAKETLSSKKLPMLDFFGATFRGPALWLIAAQTLIEKDSPMSYRIILAILGFGIALFLMPHVSLAAEAYRTAAQQATGNAEAQRKAAEQKAALEAARIAAQKAAERAEAERRAAERRRSREPSLREPPISPVIADY